MYYTRPRCGTADSPNLGQDTAPSHYGYNLKHTCMKVSPTDPTMVHKVVYINCNLKTVSHNGTY